MDFDRDGSRLITGGVRYRALELDGSMSPVPGERGRSTSKSYIDATLGRVLHSRGRSVDVVDPRTGRTLRTIGPLPEIARGAQLSIDGSRVGVWFGRRVRVLDANGAGSLDVESAAPIVAFALDPRGERLALATRDRVSFHDLDGANEPVCVECRPVALSWAPDGSRAAVATTEREVWLVEPASGSVALRLGPTAQTVSTVRFDRSATKLAAGCQRGEVVVWQLRRPPTAIAGGAPPPGAASAPPAGEPGLVHRLARPRALIGLDRRYADPVAAIVRQPFLPARWYRLCVAAQESLHALRDDDEHVTALEGIAWFRLGDVERARRCLQQSVRLVPQPYAAPFAHFCDARSGERPRMAPAGSSLPVSSAIAPQHEVAVLLEDGGRAAYDVVRESLTSTPSRAAAVAAIESRLGSDDHRLELARQLLRLHDGAIDQYAYMAWLFVTTPGLDARDYAAALDWARRASAARQDRYCRFVLGAALCRGGQWRDSLRLLEPMLESAELHDEEDSLAWAFAAMCHHRLGEAARARDCFQRVIVAARSRRLESSHALTAMRAELAPLLGDDRR